jgi:hypothetical protein
MLSPDERAILIRCSYDHHVAFCPDCASSYRIDGLGADLFRGKTDLCPQCRADLSDSIREHLESCRLVTRQRSQQGKGEERSIQAARLASHLAPQRSILETCGTT